MAAAGDHDDPEIYGETPDSIMVQTLTDWFDRRGRKWRGSQTLRQIGSLVAQSRPASRSISTEMNPFTALRHFINSERDMVDRSTIRKLILKNRYFYLAYFLIEAAKHGKLMILEELIKLGADPHANNELPLVIAAENGHFEIVQYLIEEHSADIKFDLIQKIAMKGQLEILMYLVEERRVIPNLNVLLGAITGDQLDVVQYLVEFCGVNSHAKDEWPLKFAVMRGRLDIIKYLIEVRRADPHIDDDNLIILATTGGYLEVLKYLIEEQGLNPHTSEDRAYKIAQGNFDLRTLNYLIKF
jgi:hypothetical protein